MSLTADVLYACDDVRVTRTMVTIGGSSYPVSGISSVRVTSARPSRRVARATAAVFALLAAAAFVRFTGIVVGIVTGEAVTTLFYLVVFLLPVAVAMRRIRDGAYLHTLWLRDARGEVGALVSPDLRTVGAVADAIGRAVYGRR